MRNKLLLFFAPFLTLIVVGCGGEPAFDDASVEALIKLDQAAMPVDRVPGTFTYYAVRPDARKCLAPMCGGWFVRGINRATTACADGTNNAECYVANIDWDRLGLDATTLAALTDAARQSEVIVRGQLLPYTYGHFGNLGRLTATEGWRAPNQRAPVGPMFRVHDTGILCFAAPCLSLRAEVVNWSTAINLSDVSFDRTCATEKEVAAARAAMERAEVLIAGYPRDVYEPTWRQPGRQLIATQFYTRVVPAPPPPDDNTCGGFVGKLCAAGQYCDITVLNACHGADLPGVCKVVPQYCIQVYDPVCGCDGTTYGNDCARLAAHVQLAYHGACIH